MKTRVFSPGLVRLSPWAQAFVRCLAHFCTLWAHEWVPLGAGFRSLSGQLTDVPPNGTRTFVDAENTCAISEDLQAMTRRLGVVALIATQVSREAGGDGSRKLHLGSSRDSGVYEEVCDYQIGLRRLDRCLALTQAER